MRTWSVEQTSITLTNIILHVLHYMYVILLPHYHDTTPHYHDTTPHYYDTTPHYHDTMPHYHDTTSPSVQPLTSMRSHHHVRGRGSVAGGRRGTVEPGWAGLVRAFQPHTVGVVVTSLWQLM